MVMVGKVPCVCETCGKSFERCPSQIANRKGTFCSKECAGKAKRRKPNCVCKRCGKEFGISPSLKALGNGQYCSKECQSGQRITKTCTNCGKEFSKVPSKIRDGAQYCSRKCHVEARQKTLLRVDKVCGYCGKAFQTTPSLQERKKYCSLKCQHLGQREKVEVECAHCGQLFTDFPSKIKAGRRFCSNACATAANDKRIEVACKFCGNIFLSSQYFIDRGLGMYCSRDCVGRAHSGSGSALWRGGEFYTFGLKWKVQRKLAYERDGGICQHCGLTEEKSLKKWGERNSVHHIIKRRTFREQGIDIEESSRLTNLITLCKSCHKKAEWGKIILQPKLL